MNTCEITIILTFIFLNTCHGDDGLGQIPFDKCTNKTKLVEQPDGRHLMCTGVTRNKWEKCIDTRKCAILITAETSSQLDSDLELNIYLSSIDEPSTLYVAFSDKDAIGRDGPTNRPLNIMYLKSIVTKTSFKATADVTLVYGNGKRKTFSAQSQDGATNIHPFPVAVSKDTGLRYIRTQYKIAQTIKVPQSVPDDKKFKMSLKKPLYIHVILKRYGHSLADIDSKTPKLIRFYPENRVLNYSKTSTTPFSATTTPFSATPTPTLRTSDNSTNSIHTTTQSTGTTATPLLVTVAVIGYPLSAILFSLFILISAPAMAFYFIRKQTKLTGCPSPFLHTDLPVIKKSRSVRKGVFKK